MILCFCFCFAAEAQAKQTSHLYANGMTKQGNGFLMIPVCLEHNSGIMGFKIELGYNPDELEIVTVVQGEALNAGMLSENHGLIPGECTILWSHSEDITADGVLFYLGIWLKKDSESKIQVSYSKEDTFNENWETISWKADDIQINKDVKTQNAANMPKEFSDALIQGVMEQNEIKQKLEENILEVWNKTDQSKSLEAQIEDICMQVIKECEIRELKQLESQYPENYKKI